MLEEPESYFIMSIEELYFYTAIKHVYTIEKMSLDHEHQ